jgi:PAS domain S-box-containing protein
VQPPEAQAFAGPWLSAMSDNPIFSIPPAMLSEYSLLRQAAELVPVFTWIAGPDLHCFYVNQRWREFRGRTIEQERGSGWADGIHPEDRAAALEKLDKFWSLKQPFQVELRMQRHDGEYRWVMARGQPRFAPLGDFLGYIGICFDISDKKAAEQALRESESRYRSVITSMVEGIALCDASGRILACNPSAERILGLRHEEILAHSLIDPPWRTIREDGSPFTPGQYPLAVTLLTGRPCREVVMGIEKDDGTVIWLSVNSQPVFDSVGEPSFAVATFNDITQRKQYEEDLVYHGLALSQVGEAVVTLDAQGRIRTWNEAASRIYGYSASDMAGESIDRIIPPFDGVPGREELARVAIERGRWSGRTRRRRRNGELFWVDLAVSPLRDHTGRLLGTVGIARDVSDAVEAEQALHNTAEQFRTLFEAGPLPAFVIDIHSGRFLAVNAAAVAAYGYLREEFAGMTAFEIASPDQAERLRSTLASHGQCPAGVWRHRRRDGTVFDAKIISRQICHNGHDAAVCLIQDETAPQKAQQALEEARQRAEQASLAKSEFLASMSHEIRTPLNAIFGMTRLLLDSPLTGEQRFNAEVVLKSANNLLTLISDILDFSKIEAGRIDLETVEFDLLACMEEVVDLLEQQAEGKGIGLLLNYPDSTPRRVVGDPTRVRQIVLNFASNAVKFTESGYVLIEVRSRPEPGGQEFFTISVHDTGIGIAQEKLSALFERFTQADSSTTRRFGGTGLGLAITRQLTVLMGGQIHVVSHPGEGSTFSCEIPLPLVDPDLSQRQPPANQQRLIAGRRILVVEDNQVNQRVASRLLEKLGCRVDLAANGIEAIQMTSRFSYDLVFMDCQMPEMDGFEASRQIRARQRSGARLPIIAMTAYAMKGDRERCLLAGMDDYLPKPIQPEALRGMIEKWAGAVTPFETPPSISES